jgi:uncharacterized membrane protein
MFVGYLWILLISFNLIWNPIFAKLYNSQTDQIQIIYNINKSMKIRIDLETSNCF